MLGIEIETSSIKVAYIGKKYELTEWEIFEVPEGAIGPEGIIDFDSVINTLLKIPPKFNMKNPKAAFAISGPAYTAVRVIQVPYIDKEEIALNLPFELDKHIPFNVKEVYFDFHILEKLKKENSTEVLVAVATKQIINEYVNIFEKAGIIPQVVDVGALALYNVYEFNYKEPEPTLIVNVGENFINFVIAQDNKPLYIRDSTIALNIDIQKAQDEEIRNFADDVSAEIYRQIEYVKSFLPEKPVKKIYLTGFPVIYPTFISSVEERLDQEIFIFDPFKKIKINKKISAKMQKYLHISSISIGLALRGTEKIK
ncbi:type IV pilus assembly protein PilM [Thermodesulfovibrio aggregans]|uniref:Type IV pilus assembly protein PilM n=1 Tax=Thermodesulfovibrio aggregans TaxID=86166 RepID=A0A0U9HRI0_9BACT|nr:pilus assembly protein PilM [Thermodesulfovibrio aggregans]GAQ95648.1 type IV pilus assembly protein PilM [Thermodesulfovibrio aggregans]